MNKVLISALVVAAVAAGALAQQPAPDRRKLAREAQEFQKSLNFTDAQKAKLKAINDKYLPKITALREAQRKEREAVYTPEQKAKLVAYQKKLLEQFTTTTKKK